MRPLPPAKLSRCGVSHRWSELNRHLRITLRCTTFVLHLSLARLSSELRGFPSTYRHTLHTVCASLGIRPILTALRTGLVYRSTPVMRYVVIRLCYHHLGRHTAYYRSCVPLGLIGKGCWNRTNDTETKTPCLNHLANPLQTPTIRRHLVSIYRNMRDV